MFVFGVLALGLWAQVNQALAESKVYDIIPDADQIRNHSINVCEVTTYDEPTATKGVKIGNELLSDFFELDKKSGQLWCGERSDGSLTYGGVQYKADLEYVGKDAKYDASIYSFKCGNFFTRTQMNGYFAFDADTGDIVSYAARYFRSNMRPNHVSLGLGTMEVLPLGGWSPIKTEQETAICDGLVNVSHLLHLEKKHAQHKPSPFDRLANSTNK